LREGDDVVVGYSQSEDGDMRGLSKGLEDVIACNVFNIIHIAC